MKNFITFILPTHNEERNIIPLIKEILELNINYEIEIIVVDDDSVDQTQILVKKLSKIERRVRLINRIGRYGLSSAINEGCLNSTGEVIAIMDSDGQHEVKSVYEAIDLLINGNYDLIIGSRFLEKSSIKGLSAKRKDGSSYANILARNTLSKEYRHITDYMSGCFVFKTISCMEEIKKIDVNGFKFLYELLALTKGKLKIKEIPLQFKSRKFGYSKLDIAVIWDFVISLIHTFINRIIPRKAISFGVVGSIGVLVHLAMVYFLISITSLSFIQVLPFAGVSAASSNFLINNMFTFRNKRLRGIGLFYGLLKFLMVSSIPLVANVGLAASYYTFISPNTFISQMAGIIVVFIWNYVASSKFVWKE